MLNYVLSYLTLAVLFIVQTTLSCYIDIYGIAPNLIFVFIVCYSIYNFPVRSGFLCVIAGIIVDLYSRKYVGLNALLYMYIGYMNGLFHNIFYPDDIKLPLIMVTVSDLLYSVVVYVLLFLLNSLLIGLK